MKLNDSFVKSRLILIKIYFLYRKYSTDLAIKQEMISTIVIHSRNIQENMIMLNLTIIHQYVFFCDLIEMNSVFIE